MATPAISPAAPTRNDIPVAGAEVGKQSAQRPSLPPGPRAPAQVQTYRFIRQPISSVEDYWHRYGDMFTVDLGFGDPVVQVAEPELAREVLTGDSGLMHAGENASALEPIVGGESLLLLEEERHMRHRKLLLPPFHGKSIVRYQDLIAQLAAKEVESWPQEREFAVAPRMKALTLEVILRTIFGIQDHSRLERLRTLIPRTGRLANLLFLPWLQRDLGSWSPWGRFLRLRAQMDEVIYEEIAARRTMADDPARDDVLSLMLAARFDDGSPMTDSELRDELMTLLQAGHETSSTGLTWAFERLSRSPEVLATLTKRLADGDETYLEATLKEALRVRPPVAAAGRRLTAPYRIGDYVLPSGTRVWAAIPVIHRRPEIWPAPERFEPERHLNGEKVPYSWIPFGGGVRRCIGASFAMVEMQTILATILHAVEVRTTAKPDETPRGHGVVVVPGRGARISVRRREAPIRI